jgi:acetolactate synthase I/II/III large subunit
MPSVTADIPTSLEAALDAEVARIKGPVDLVKYAEAFGATGLMIRTPDEIAPTLKKAFNVAGPVIVGLHVDYRDNVRLFEMVSEDSIH